MEMAELDSELPNGRRTMRVERYTEAAREQWERFVSTAKNGTFMHTRKFIDYHGDRFVDASLMVFDDSNELKAIIPMNEKEGVVYSHQGLTYGGILILSDLRLDEYVEVFKAILHFAKNTGWKKWIYKCIPSMYYKYPAFEDEHLLFLVGATKVGQHVNPSIQRSPRLNFQERRKRGVKKAIKEGVVCAESNDIVSYWRIVSELLANYSAKPVHSLEEIQDLISRFPEQIRLYTSTINNEMVSGILCFESDDVVRFQYIASTLKGKDTGALDALFAYLIDDVFVDVKFIDFGTSTNDAGRKLAMGISQQKEGFGARTSIQPIYEVDLNVVNWEALNHFVS